MSWVPRRIQLQEAAQADELKEWPDPTPVEVPGLGRPRSIQELVVAEVQRLMAERAAAAPPTSDDDEDDWDFGSDFTDPLDGLSVHQWQEMERDVVLEDRQRALDQAALQETAPEEGAGSDDQALSDGLGTEVKAQ